jgi:hypothetical protein
MRNPSWRVRDKGLRKERRRPDPRKGAQRDTVGASGHVRTSCRFAHPLGTKRTCHIWPWTRRASTPSGLCIGCGVTCRRGPSNQTVRTWSVAYSSHGVHFARCAVGKLLFTTPLCAAIVYIISPVMLLQIHSGSTVHWRRLQARS